MGFDIAMHEEALHGYVAPGATSFPQAIALASTWNPKLQEQIFAVAAREMRARGAIPLMVPNTDASPVVGTFSLPPAVEAVCVPWPRASTEIPEPCAEPEFATPDAPTVFPEMVPLKLPVPAPLAIASALPTAPRNELPVIAW